MSTPETRVTIMLAVGVARRIHGAAMPLDRTMLSHTHRDAEKISRPKIPTAPQAQKTP